MSKFSLLKYLLLALFLGMCAAEAPAQELEVAEAVAVGSEIPTTPPPVALSPAESNSVEADEFAPPPIEAPPAITLAPEEEAATAPIPAPPPLPEIDLAPPVAPPQALFTSAPTLQTVQQKTPVVEVWRDRSSLPQTPERYGGGRNHHQRLMPAVTTGYDPVTVRLQFHSSAAGKQVLVKTAWGLTVDPPDEVLTVDARGECIVMLTLEPGLPQSHVSFFCDGMTTTLPLARTSLEVVEAIEGGNGQGGQMP